MAAAVTKGQGLLPSPGLLYTALTHCPEAFLGDLAIPSPIQKLLPGVLQHL